MSDRMLVLVIEDTTRVRQTLIDALESAGFRALGAETALEGIRLARAKRPDLIVVDVGLPDQDGGVAISCLKDYPGFETIPMLVVSGLPEETLRVKAQDTGAVAFLRKPFRPEVFLQCVKHWIVASEAS